MITESEAIRQVLRMSGLPGFPQRQEGEDELMRAFQVSCRDLEHATRITDTLIHGAHFCPTPADIYELAAANDREYDPHEWRCATCGNTGWEEVYELHTWRDGTRKETERITKLRYKQLLPRVAGKVGDQVVTTAMIRCTGCKLGRNRALAETMEAHA